MENVVVIYDRKSDKYHATERKKKMTLNDLQAFIAARGQHLGRVRLIDRNKGSVRLRMVYTGWNATRTRRLAWAL